MDRQIVYPGAIPLETDLLNTNKYAMIGLAKLASALLGSNTYVHGLACTASSPASMVINVAAGQIYSLQNIDGTAYSSLAADTTHTILKQGLVLDATQFTLTAPGTSGYSVNYLIQAAYTDTDSGATVLPYYNASNPSVAWSGPNNSGTAQNTVRSGICTVALKAGVAATTGTQTTPSPDTGYTGLYVITVAQGATTVTAANISVYPNAPILNQAGIYDSFQRNTAIYGVDTGSANAYVVNINPKILSLTDGAEVIFKATNANTTSSTLNVCALGVFPVTSKSGSTLIANEIVANSLVKVRWSASTSSWVIIDATGTFQTAPTATAGTATNQVATTAFVANAILVATGRLVGAPKIFTSNGAYTPTAGTSFIIVEAIGGGGGGGGSYTTSSGQRACAGGGGAGGYGRALFTSGFSSVAVTIGNGGVGGAANTATAGGAGGVTSFGSLLVCSGGTGGTFSSNWAMPIHTSGAPSGTATSGANLGTHSAPAGAAGYYANNGWLSGAGASSPLGRGGVQIGGTSAGQAATGFGSGGGGAATGDSATGQSGGAGSNGVVIVWEYM